MALPHLLLTELLNSQSGETGYDLTKHVVRGRLSFMWHASHQQVYRELGKLEAAGLVDCTHEPQQGKPDRKRYNITPAGKTELQYFTGKTPALKTVRDELSVNVLARKACNASINAMINVHLELCQLKLEKLRASEQLLLNDTMSVSLLHRQIQMLEADIVWSVSMLNETYDQSEKIVEEAMV
ncbi:PadR family transcriptional regulator [Vibrio sp. ABG19]|uniref:PadR family transcriptional regulator n=1 Tax=Vibrio sp. ABG19 TaxID=2817385 RepID=UPI00249DB6E5|nr:PadR family transcriptional regulator [Vibrio sp. ABG19]WGY45248.1 PadR family transcriptional regulator [Vibrio sp. ABG19]